MTLLHLITALTRRLDRDEDGATAVEYGLMVAAIAAVIVLVVIALGQQLLNVFGFVEAEMTRVVP